ncbi:hypothetical protein BOW53_14860 [Solemya pervernicosa gill symbiont]|uniref:Uncharacterized protein n=2 Tax=Gammaproteobacteria incertae sedis TaxID=118884 RepID=A0A1T2L0H5_9GAMM|nr:hypothetical protein [Candidatus Reidiella endopervernicosa]OOZ38617.1 hypothetical protein BOW53_14860 [Solemya pervernicosa gill symbiont]QKQ25993.1 hypothetical protein HUE57_06620 [Candidatus Reidiella endopervernicosa]
MDNDKDGLIKHREIIFCELHFDKNQGQTALLLLSDIEGVHHLRVSEKGTLHISYNLQLISLKIIEDALIELGFHISSNLLNKLKRALYHYTEETQRANLGCCRDNDNCTREIFINRYQRIRHGCRDERPTHWRKYL